MWAYCPPEPPLLRASPCASFHSLPTPWGVVPHPTFATWQGVRWPLRVASLYLPPCPSGVSLQRHQVLSLHNPLRFASLFIPRSLAPFSVFLSGIGVKGASGSRS